MPTYAFTGGVAETPAFGKKGKIRFVGTWIAGDSWIIPITSTVSGDFTTGKGNISGQTFSCALKLRNRMYLGFTNKFALSSTADPTKWEDQDPGSGVIDFLSQFGNQDTIQGFASLQGRLAVLASLSCQIWSVDADPSQMALLQTLDNTGAISTLSIKSIGDLDVLYLDKSGFRSLRAKESTLNAFVNDAGTAIDLTVQAALVGYDASAACAVVEPTTKQYWCYLNGNIYVLSSYPKSQIVAWSTYKATEELNLTSDGGANYVGGVGAGIATWSGLTTGVDYYWTKGTGETQLVNPQGSTLTSSGYFTAVSNQATVSSTNDGGTAITGSLHLIASAFTPVKMLAYSGQVYILSSAGMIYRYGGSDNNTFDRTRVTIKTPWLDLKQPSQLKQAYAIDAAMNGDWEVLASMNPYASAFLVNPISPVNVIDKTNAHLSFATTTAPLCSTFDIGRFNFSANGTHIQLTARTNYTPYSARLSMINFLFKKAGEK